MATRIPSEWMVAADDRILEYLESEGAASITTMDDDYVIDYHYNTISRRCRKLESVGLLERVGEGVYRITSKGRGYLVGQEDLRDVDNPEADDG